MKVHIIGAGPAGTSTAISLLRQRPDADVEIWEKRREIGVPARCAGGVTIKDLAQLNISLPEEAVLTFIRGLRFYGPTMDYCEFTTEKPTGMVIRRDLFDQHLAKIATNLGAKIRTGTLYDAEPSEYLIHAEGYDPTVPPKDIHLCLQYEGRITDYPPDIMGFYYGLKLAPHGYGWVFPCGRGAARVGIGVPLSIASKAKGLLDAFADRVGAEKTNLVGKALVATWPMKNIVPNVFWVGDAGHWCDPFWGLGIAPALISGSACGRALAEGHPERYDSYMRWIYLRNSLMYRLKKVLYACTDRDFNDLIEALKGINIDTAHPNLGLFEGFMFAMLKKPRLIKPFLSLFK